MLRALPLLLLFTSCAPTTTAAPPAVPAEGSTAGTSPDAEAPATPNGETAAPATSAAVSPSASAPSGPPPAPPAGTPLLPRVSVKTMGLHVGGGPNDAVGKAPFLQAIEPRFPDFLRCYQLVGEPGSSGSFGVDLHIEKAGGKAKLEQPRSALVGEPFKECVIGVFESIDFPPLKKAFVISYSLRFSVEP